MTDEKRDYLERIDALYLYAFVEEALEIMRSMTGEDAELVFLNEQMDASIEPRIDSVWLAAGRTLMEFYNPPLLSSCDLTRAGEGIGRTVLTWRPEGPLSRCEFLHVSFSAMEFSGDLRAFGQNCEQLREFTKRYLRPY